MTARKKKIDQQEALQRMQKYCSEQERNSAQIWRKLKSYGLNYSDAQQIISELIEQDFLNEERYALAYAQGKFKMNKWGKQKILMGLRKDMVSERNQTVAIQSIDMVNYRKLIADLIKKYSAQKDIDLSQWDQRQKVVRYLLQKGFENTEIQNSIESLI